MSKTKELLMQMYDKYDAIEGSCNQLEEHLRNLEHEYYKTEKNESTNCNAK